MTEVVPLRPAPVLSAVCGDCGADVVWYPPKDRWASKIAENDAGDAWSFHCRTVRVGGLLVSADFHFVPPEVQERFRRGKA